MIRDAAAKDFDQIVSLNLECEAFLDPLPAEKLARLVPLATYFKVAIVDSCVAGFLLAFPDHVPYDYPAYAWFVRHRKSFVYVDRIAIGEGFRARGIARDFYDDLIAWARGRALGTIACEFDVSPPNASSERLHQRYGFKEVKRIPVQGGKKVVSLQELSL